MSAVDAETGIDIEELVGPLDSIPCELNARHHGEDRPPAAWYLISLCCDYPTLAICAGCWGRTVAKWTIHPTWTLLCNGCPRRELCGNWQRMRKVEPITKEAGRGR